MGRNLLRIGIALAAAAALAGCRVNVDKDKNGDEKRVQIDTPFGGLHVNTDQTTAADLGLPVYPGAQAFKDNDKHQSADVHMGFGEWQLRVKAVSYSTPDSEDKVLAFYKKALGRYGDVLTCKGKQPIGSPTVTAEGLTCADDSGKHTDGNVDSDEKKKSFHYGVSEGLELKAGSKKHQHIVGIEDKKEDSKTVFALVALDLPITSGKED